MNGMIRVFLCLLLCRAVAGAAESPMPHPKEQPLAVVRAGRADSVRRLLDTVTADVFGLTLDNRGGPLPFMTTGPDSYDEFLNALIENEATNLWYALPQNGTMLDTRVAGGGWTIPDWTGGQEAGEEFLRSHGFDPDGMASRWGDGDAVIASDAATLEALTAGTFTAMPWPSRLEWFLQDNPDAVGVYMFPRPFIGMASVLTGEDIRSEMSRLRLAQPHSATVDAYTTDGDFIGFDVQVDGLFARPPHLTAASRSTLAVGPERTGDMIRLTIAEPLPYLELMGLDKNVLYPLNLDMLAFVPEVATITLWMDEYRHWNWSAALLIKDTVRFKRQYRRMTGWLDLLAKTPFGYVDVDMVQTPDGEAVRRVRVGDFEFCIGAGENARLGEDTMLLMASGRAEDFPGVANVRLDRNGPQRAVEWTAVLGEDNRYAIADFIAYQLHKNGIDIPGLDVLETAIPSEETGFLRVDGVNAFLSSPNGMAAWLAPLLPEVEREILLRILP